MADVEGTDKENSGQSRVLRPRRAEKRPSPGGAEAQRRMNRFGFDASRAAPQPKRRKGPAGAINFDDPADPKENQEDAPQRAANGGQRAAAKGKAPVATRSRTRGGARGQRAAAPRDKPDGGLQVQTEGGSGRRGGNGGGGRRAPATPRRGRRGGNGGVGTPRAGRTPSRAPAPTPGGSVEPVARALAGRHFAGEDEWREALDLRVKAKKWDHKAAAQQMKPMVGKLRRALLEALEAKDTLVAAFESTESDLRRAATASEHTLASAQRERDAERGRAEEAERSLAEARESAETARRELEAADADAVTARADTSAAAAARDAALERVGELEEEAAGLRREVEAGKAREAEAEAAQAAAREEVAELNKRHVEALAEERAKGGDVAARVGEVEERLTESEAAREEQQKRAEAAESRAATLEAEGARAKEEVARLEAEAASLRERLQQRDSEVQNVLETFKRSQDMSEERSRQLQAEKGSLEERTREHEEALRSLETRLREEVAAREEQERCRAKAEEEARAAEAAREAAQEEAQAARSELEAVRAEKGAHEREAAALNSVTSELKDQAREAQELRVAERAVAEADKRQLNERLEESRKRAEEAEKTLQARIEKAQEDLAQRDTEVQELRSEVESLKSNFGSSDSSQLEKLAKLAAERDRLAHAVQDSSAQREEVTRMQARIEELEGQVFDCEAARRKLHNKVQELRGNVRVFSRVRPMLAMDGEGAGEGDEAPTPVLCRPDAMGLKVEPTKEGGEPHTFSFDRVFQPSASQKDVFNEVSDFVQSALDGYNVCLFSYGQTGSGKTHTMQGSVTGDERGIIPRSMEKIVQCTHKLRLRGWEYRMEASFLEIYNESIRDLLDRANKGGAAAGGSGGASGLKLALGGNGAPEVKGLTWDPVATEEDVEGLMARAAQARSVSSTSMNEQSSRSHSVFSLRLRGVHREHGVALTGSLNLVDLAGSERLARSKAEGARLKETQAINKSLSCLADVFAAIGRKASHIPFRNSKLTHLLQPCFRGDGKTLMMVNLSPTVDSHHETLCSLRFAERVNQCQLGRPERRMQTLAGGGEGGAAKSEGGATGSASSSTAAAPAAVEGGGTGTSKPAQGTKRSARPATGPAAKRATTRKTRRPETAK